jgi:hypothetical protein
VSEPLGYSFDGVTVTLRMRRQDYNLLAFALGVAAGGLHDSGDSQMMVDLMNRLNAGNPEIHTVRASEGGAAVMRDEVEIIRAHDILRAVALREVSIQLDEDSRLILHCVLDALCWVLHHDHNTKFADNLQEIETAAAKAGFVICDDEPNSAVH